MAKGSKAIQVAAVSTIALPRPLERSLKKESPYASMYGGGAYEPGSGTVPAGMHFRAGPKRETPYGEGRGIEPPTKRFAGMKKGAYDGR